MATTTGNDETDDHLPRTRGNLVQRVVQWLRAGYPDGVPQQDYVALLGILRRSLTESELGQVVAELADEAEAQQQILTRGLVEQRIQDVVKGPIDDGRRRPRLAQAGVRRLATRLPLAAAPGDAGDDPHRARVGASSSGSGRATPPGCPRTTTCRWWRCCAAGSPTTSCARSAACSRRTG